MKKKVNYYKIISLVFLIIDIAIVIWVNTGFKKAELITWLLFEAIVMMIPVNVMLILRRKYEK